MLVNYSVLLVYKCIYKLFKAIMMIDYSFKMMSLFEYAICLFFLCTMFCLNSIVNIVTYFYPRLEKND
jgi:hypothetical protein